MITLRFYFFLYHHKNYAAKSKGLDVTLKLSSLRDAFLMLGKFTQLNSSIKTILFITIIGQGFFNSRLPLGNVTPENNL